MKFVANFGSYRVIIYPNDKTEKPSHERSRYIYIYINCLCGSVAKASDTQAVGHGFDPRPDH